MNVHAALIAVHDRLQIAFLFAIASHVLGCANFGSNLSGVSGDHLATSIAKFGCGVNQLSPGGVLLLGVFVAITKTRPVKGWLVTFLANVNSTCGVVVG